MKVALVYSFSDSDWFSCRIILKNLISSYLKLYGEKNIIKINYSKESDTTIGELKKLITEDVQKVVVLDHRPSPLIFFKSLIAAEDKKLNLSREYIFHIYGDFPFYIYDWYELSVLLKKARVKLICASLKQKKFIEKFFKQKTGIFVCPFPVDPKEFNFDEKLRSRKRLELGLEEQDSLFIYTGRMSYQKRITDMVEQFCIALQNGALTQNSKLILLGPFDKLKLLFLGDFGVHGEYFRSIDKVIQKYSKYAANIEFMGSVDHDQLQPYYNASDCFYSLATYHDEDYGMAVAEGICTGLPIILTSWAGYTSFSLDKNPEASDLIPVKLAKVLPEIDFSVAQLAIKKFSNHSAEKRKKNQEFALSEFSISACTEKLRSIHDYSVDPFDGVTDFMKLTRNEASRKTHELWKFETEKKYNHLYYKAYDVYAE
jgi:glycosyltransferase involved in cell wall biosynthesis